MTIKAPTTNQLRDAWDALAPGFDEFVSPLTSALAEVVLGKLDILPGLRFLDVGAGSGALAIPVARLGAQVVAVDIAPTMIKRLAAHARVAGLSNLESRVMDGQDLELVDDGFDVSASLNGVTSFGDPRAGLAELVRVTKPGGQVMIAAFGAPKAEWVGFFLGAVRVAVPSLLPPLDSPAHEVADTEQLRRELTNAGLTDVRVETTTWRVRFRSALHLWDVATFSNPSRARLTSDLSDRQVAEAQQVLDGMLRERSGGHPGAVLLTELDVGTGVKRAAGPKVP